MLSNSSNAQVLTNEVALEPPCKLVEMAPEPNRSQQLPQPQGLLRRMWKHPRLMQYHRLFFIVAALNLAMLHFGITEASWWSANGIALKTLADLVIANFFIAILIRQNYVVNLLFWIATRAPTSWPLSIRRSLGKVYHFGGLHSGCAVAGTLWFAAFSGSLLLPLSESKSGVSDALIWISGGLMTVLVVILVLALPSFRARFHNNFEMAHRFGGWAALILFWAQTVIFIRDQNPEQVLAISLLNSASTWMLAIITLSIALPWLRLKKVPVVITKPSDHAVLVKFDHGVTPFAGSSTPLSRNPLFEWHSFANVPSPRESGFRLTISRAGDWTGKFIDDTPSHVWVKAIPTAGVGNIDVLFKRVVWIATGSGIGPCLPHLLSGNVPAHLVWSTRNPRKTYGDAFVDEVLLVQPDALIWDTEERGRPDLVTLAYQACQDFQAEAVICIANQKLTYQVVYGMESRGIPAYGAIWDS